VVPRVPGGEITPDKLIALGETAKKYDLYTKITGGQRIDLFGAQLHELPLIWKDLIDAGFESGHAYGKALRTVKSCVGSTWCRYGMHESVTFAIEIENRYKGLRSPHKLKGGVSGCIRECAEARGKDFGLIAVEGGWNLYICGNGGATPKHAVLFAEKLDDATCIKYLDRFLMYYIRTAGPLVRTAPWLEKLEGGIEYLKKVIIEDALGIADELEREMQGLVNKYECEWKQAIEDPNMSKRFRHFVNSEDTDDNLVFVPMRDQKKPKAWI
jgi:nitrite reductase (NADH) large subunit